MRVAAVQLTAGPDRDANLAEAGRLVEAAVAAGARFVVLPELFSLLGPNRVMMAGAEPLDGPTLAWARGVAADAGIWLLAGSFPEDAGDRIHNTSCLVAPSGDRVAAYRKIHLFDNDVDGAAYRESATVSPGDDVVAVEIVVDGRPITVGLATCYDLRFPELFRVLALRGAEVVVLPSAFTAVTGRAHWEPLVRARAIENQVYVVAADQWGVTGTGIACHGHSMVVDPWGEVVACRPDEPGVVVADLDLDRLHELRARLPSLANRRPHTYRGLDAP